MKVTIEKNNIAQAITEADVAVVRALEVCGLQAEKYAKAECQVDTGNLRNSITHQVNGSEMAIGTNVEYAPYQELGTSKMHNWKGPYLRPALLNHISEYQNIIKTEMSK